MADDVALHYDSTGACPDRAAFEAMVVERLGYSPFDAAAPRSADVKLRGARAQVRITVNGEVVGERTLTGSDCAELAKATALALAIAIDAKAVYSPRPDPVPERSIKPVPARVAAVERSHASDTATSRPTIHVAAGLVAALGASPDPTAGATLQFGVRRGRASLDLEGRVDRPSHVGYGTGRVYASLSFAALISCYHRGRFAGCGVLALGALRGRGEDFVDAATVTSTFAAGGARVAWEVPVSGRISARLHADLLGAFARTSLQVSGMDVWTLPPVSGAVGFSAVGHFE